MKYLFVTLLLTCHVYGQDTLQSKPKFKNSLGIAVSPSVLQDIPINTAYSWLPFTLEPLFTCSYYLEYNRTLLKRINLTVGAGMFMDGYSSILNYDPRYFDYSQTAKQTTTTYNYNASLYLKPKYFIIDKKVVFYAGLSAQFNYYLSSLSYYDYFDHSQKEINSYELLGSLPTDHPLRIYGGAIAGIGFRCKRFLLVAEPEFKIRLNSIAENDNFNPYIFYYRFTPYALGVNVMAYYSF